MTIIKKLKTAVKIFRDHGVKGVFKVISSKFDRSYRPDEAQIVFDLLKSSVQPGLMVDVGAHHGLSLKPFAQQHWQVVAFEPDSHNRQVLEENFSNYNNIIIDKRACSDKPLPTATLFTSVESSGVSGLSAFLDSHHAGETITVTTLGSALSDYGLASQIIDFLKIDTEGYDLMVLKGFPWEASPHPVIVLCEFEDKKTKPLGYNFYDLADFLVDLGYRLVISEWYPIKSYGSNHRWRDFSIYPSRLTDPNGWGNIFAIKDELLFHKFLKILKIE